MVKISVIIPVYNVENFLPQCLDSVCQQTLKDIEIICINDGSTDNSARILAAYAQKDARIKILSQANAGVSISRNNGLKIAGGQYIGFVDSDDWIAPDFYEKLYQAATLNLADIAVGGIMYHHKKDKTMINYKKCRIATTLNQKFKLLKLPRYSYIWNKIYKRELILDTPILFKPHVVYEDIIWTTDITAQATKICAVPHIFYHYRQNPNSITNSPTQSSSKKLDCQNAIKYQTDFIQAHHVKVDLPCINKTYIRFCGLKLIKVIETAIDHRFYLFGAIKLFNIKKSPNI